MKAKFWTAFVILLLCSCNKPYTPDKNDLSVPPIYGKMPNGLKD